MFCCVNDQKYQYGVFRLLSKKVMVYAANCHLSVSAFASGTAHILGKNISLSTVF